MITLITGAPDAGKTSYAVSYILTLLETDKKRPLYVHGIEELQLPHKEIDPMQWHTTAIPGSIIILDEARDYWPPAPAGSSLPPSIDLLSKHRHQAYDFIILTQHPSFIHTAVRKLVNKHIHIEARWNGRYSYEWPRCQNEVERTSGAIERPHKLDKNTFGLYKSSDYRTTIERKKPLSLYVLLGVLALLTISGFKAYQLYKEKTNTQTITQSANSKLNSPVQSKIEQALDFVPRIANNPESAPAYDDVRKVTDFPRLKGCISSSRLGCKCIDQQGTPYPLPDSECLEFISRSQFDPYRNTHSEYNGHAVAGGARKRDTRPADRVMQNIN